MPRAPIPPAVLLLFVIDLGLGIAYFLDYLAGQPSSKLTTLVNLDGESNLSTWYASVKWFSIAAMLALFARLEFRRSQRASWPLFMLPVVFLLLSLDETAEIHEWLGDLTDVLLPDATRTNTIFSTTGIWMFVVGLPFVVFILMLIRSLRPSFTHAPAALTKQSLGMVVMLTGAIGVEIFRNFVTQDSLYYVLQVITEESLEMLGATLIFWGSYELLERCGFTIQTRVGSSWGRDGQSDGQGQMSQPGLH